MDLNLLRSAVTLLGLTAFLALMVWTWWPRQKAAMDAAARLPFSGEADDDGARPGEHRAAPGPAHAPSGGRATYSSIEGLQ
jgi:cbb3-type cytochrome oxidase subunit 3